MSTETKKPAVSYPYKGMADLSWPVCPGPLDKPGCGGLGVVTQELARLGLGAKGDPCTTCNGAGRVPDPSWPKCACREITDDCAAICGGLGQLSPEAQGSLVAKARAAEAELEAARKKLDALERGVPRALGDRLAAEADATAKR